MNKYIKKEFPDISSCKKYKEKRMFKHEGWSCATIYSQYEHYFINGKSLCNNFLILGYKYFDTTNNPCPICMNKLNKKKEEQK